MFINGKTFMLPPLSSPAPFTLDVRPSIHLLAPAPVSAPAPARSPRHLAIVVDSGRTCRASSPVESLNALREVMHGCIERGVRWLSLFVPDIRPATPAAFSMLETFVNSESESLALWGIRLRAATSTAALNGSMKSLVSALNKAAELSIVTEKLCLTLAVNANGKAQLLDAVRRMASQSTAGDAPASKNAQSLEKHLSLSEMPPVDLLIRTGGESRLSSFLLWQAAYAELLFLETPWTQFRRATFDSAMSDYARRNRTFGALPSR